MGGEREASDPDAARILVSRDWGDSWQAVLSPLKSGAASGVFSIAFANAQQGVAVGGTYDNPADASGNIGITNDGGETWLRPDRVPRGYRSCVLVLKGNRRDEPPRWLALGKTGSDYSVDGGKSWKPLSDEGFYAAAADLYGKRLIAVGTEGKIGVLQIPQLQLD